GKADGYGQVFAYSGKTANLLWTDSGNVVNGHLGFSTAILGDGNGDGFADVIAGAPEGIIDDSYVRVYSGNPSPWAVLGGGRAGSRGTPRMRGVGFPSSGTEITVTMDRMLENSILLVALSLTPLSHRFPAGGTLIPFGFIVARAPTGSDGRLEAPFVWP